MYNILKNVHEWQTLAASVPTVQALALAVASKWCVSCMYVCMYV